MAKSIKEIVPLIKEESTGKQVPATYVTLAESVFFSNGKTLKDEWDSKVSDSSIVTRYPIDINDGLNQFTWQVLSFGGTYATAQARVYPEATERITYANKPGFRFVIQLPSIPVEGSTKVFKKDRSSIQVTESVNSTFFTEAVQHNVMAIFDPDNNNIVVTVVNTDGSVLTGIHVTGDFMINVSGLIE